MEGKSSLSAKALRSYVHTSAGKGVSVKMYLLKELCLVN
jgi:hypothetical protein